MRESVLESVGDFTQITKRVIFSTYFYKCVLLVAIQFILALNLTNSISNRSVCYPLISVPTAQLHK